MKVRWLTLVSAAVAGATSLYYTLTYVSRWEWNRAQLTADLTLMSGLLILGLALDARLRALTERIDARRGIADPPPHADAGPDRFRWLDTPPERYGVFIPVLLGAGMIASGLAFVMERLAGSLNGTNARARDHAPPELPATLLAPEHASLRDVLVPTAGDALLRGPGAGR